ncbi:MAG: glycoside hydrolase family 2 TIM barrel-domain containing protein [Pseudomonadota bacterium]
MAEPIPVELTKTQDGWQLQRGGEPFFIRGAGGTGSLEALRAAGGNSIRTWDAEKVRGGDDVGVLLDEAHALGLTVTVGIWLGHERHGFDYDDPVQVQQQFDRAKEIVLRYKDHPALLLWGVGNEMEGFDEADNPKIWEAVNDIGEMIKRIDPNHPTMTVTAFVHGERIEYIHNRSPGIDIHGVNAYGGAVAVPDFMQRGGASKPWVFTEYGPVGPWEMPKTDWGAPIEQTSADKADFYRRAHAEGIEAAPGQALGAYAFLWGDKMEATETWFGVFLEDGSPTAAYDALTEIWTGALPDNQAPRVDALSVDGSAELEPGAVLKVNTEMSDPENDQLTVRWVLRADTGDIFTGGDYRPPMPDIDDAVIEGTTDGATVRMPDDPGAYRLFAYAYDVQGKAGTANVPVRVIGEPKVQFPLPVYGDSFARMPWAPSGWMGNVDKLTVDDAWPENPHTGDASLRLRYEGVYNWVGVAWQHPANNWGDQAGGINVDGAKELEFWARGEYGGERISFGVGLLESDKAYPDSSITKVDNIALTPEWTRYTVPLRNKDLSSLKTGFFIALTGRQSSVTVYLDDIRFIN